MFNEFSGAPSVPPVPPCSNQDVSNGEVPGGNPFPDTGFGKDPTRAGATYDGGMQTQPASPNPTRPHASGPDVSPRPIPPSSLNQSVPPNLPVQPSSASTSNGSPDIAGKTFADIAVCAAVLALLWDIMVDNLGITLVFVLQGGWPLSLCSVAFAVCVAVMRRKQRFGAWTWFFYVVAIAIALIPAITSSMLVRRLNFCVLAMASCCAYIMAITGWEDAVRSAYGVFASVGMFIRQQFEDILRFFRGFKQHKVGTGAWVLPAVVGVAAAAIVLCITIPLLMQVNEEFSILMNRLADPFKNLSFGETVMRILRFVLAFTIGASLLWPAMTNSAADRWARKLAQRTQVKDTHEQLLAAQGRDATSPKLPPVMFTTALCVIDAAYLLFVCVEVPYLFGGAAATEVAQYAREGFFQLVAVTVVNLAVLGCAIMLGSPHSKRSTLPLMVAELVLMAVTCVMLASAAWRMGLYVSEYGLTMLRLGTSWGMMVIAMLLAVALVRIIWPTFKAFRMALAIFLVIWACFGFSRPEAMIASYNVDGYLGGTIEQIDLDYLNSLSFETREAYGRLAAQAPDSEVAKRAQAHYDQQKPDTRYWSLDTVEAALYRR